MAERSHEEKAQAAPQSEPKAAAPRVSSSAASMLALQRAAGNRAALSVQRKGSGGGAAVGLPAPIRSGLEALSGISMDGVKVHYDSPEPAAIGAQAMTKGSEIHLAPGKESHLAHEGWHVVQQRQGRVKPTIKPEGVPISDAVALEEEADVLGAKATQT